MCLAPLFGVFPHHPRSSHYVLLQKRFMNMWSYMMINNVCWHCLSFCINRFTVNMILQTVLSLQNVSWICFPHLLHSMNAWVKGEVTFPKLSFRTKRILILGFWQNLSQIIGGFPYCLILNKRSLFGKEALAWNKLSQYSFQMLIEVVCWNWFKEGKEIYHRLVFIPGG